MKKPGEDEIILFRKAVKDVRPLRQDKVIPYRQLPSPVARRRRLDDEQVLADMLSDGYDPADMENGEEIIFARSGISHSILKRLRRGYYSIQGELDLHGMIVREARQAVVAFLHECRLRHIACVRIIHGKGYGSRRQQPVLKNKLNNWLQHYDDVLAFCSAPATDGGTGAVYVLLKRHRK